MTRSTILLAIGISVWAGVTVLTQQAPSSQSVLQEQRRFMLQARAGQSDVEPATMLARVKGAIAADPANSELYRALGDVELLQAPPTTAGAVPDLAALAATVQRASGAYRRAVELDATNATAVSSEGLMLVFSSFVTMNPGLVAEGVTKLNRAVELQPSAVAPRLNRAFTSVNLQPPLRNTERTIEDLKFLISVAEGSRPGDMVHVLLGDVYAEAGRTDEARAEYRAAARRPASAAREQAAARMAALDAGMLPKAEIAAMRGSLASNCLMCHGTS